MVKWWTPAISPFKKHLFPFTPWFFATSVFVAFKTDTKHRGQYVCSTSLGIRAAKLGSLLGPVSPQSSLAKQSGVTRPVGDGKLEEVKALFEK